ncbi:Ig-like domain-containing protein [Mesorhizobium sp. M0317]|uniref:beta strand repeat-containing protein n=1 Tax=Mesorhizobium sp. M0317 TaxID=2956935 RepID=UPI00333AC29D
MTLTGSVAQINTTLAALNNVVYKGVADFNGGDTLTVLTSDAGNSGSGGTLTDSDTVAITVNTVNDAPVNTVPGAQSVNEDTALTFTGGNTISVHDVDGNLATAQLTVLHGTLNASLTGGATISSGANGSATLTLSGTETQINAALASLSYQGVLNYNGSDTLTVVSTDSAGTPLSDTDPVAITVNPVNDAPVATADTYTTTTGTMFTASPGLLANDVDPDSSITAVQDSSPANGTVTWNANGLFTYTSNAGFVGTDSFTYHAYDGSLSSSVVNVTIIVASSISGHTIDFGNGKDVTANFVNTTFDFNSPTPVGNWSILMGNGKDDVTTAWNHINGTTSYNGGTGTDHITLVFSAAQLEEILSNATFESALQSYLDGSPTGTLDLSASSWRAIVTNFENANLAIALPSGGSTTYTAIADDLPDLNAGGTAPKTLVGTSGGETINGNSGNDILVGLGGADTLNGGGGSDLLLGGSGNDILIGGIGSDLMSGGVGLDTFVIATGESAVAIGGSGGNGTVSGYDVITDFDVTTDILDLNGTPTAAINTAGTNGTDSLLTIGGQTVKSHAISNGIITFDDANTYSLALSLTSSSDVAAVVQYLRAQLDATDLGNAGATVAFTATIGGISHTFIYQQVNNTVTTASDILVDMPGVSVTNLSALIVGGHVLPAGVAGSPINLGLTEPAGVDGAAVTLQVTNLPSGWLINGGTQLSDDSWTIQTTDMSSLSVTTPADFVGAALLYVAMTWTNADGTTGASFVADNVEAFAPGTPIYAVSSDDHLTGSAGSDLFVFGQPIAADTLHNFDVAADRIDLIGFAGVNGFGDLVIADDSSGNAVVTISSGETITVQGISASGLGAGNFLFNQEPVTHNAGPMSIADGAIMPVGGAIDNTGTIALNGAGSTTQLEVIASGITLHGGGQVVLSDSDANVIFGTAADVTLTNVDNTISGAGQLGGGSLSLDNLGTIIATGSHALVIDTGGSTVVNSGTLEATGSGGMEINGAVANSGLIWANGGDVTIGGQVTGDGDALIGNMSQLEFHAASSADVIFGADAAGTLRLDDSFDFSGSIAGITNDDKVDLGDIWFSTGTSAVYHASQDGSGGTLTVSDGTHDATLHLLGAYDADSFTVADDGTGRTMVAYSPADDFHFV